MAVRTDDRQGHTHTGVLKGLAKAKNGMSCENLRRFCIGGALEPMLLYGCEMLGRRLKRREESRYVAWGYQGYSPISHEAVRVIAWIITLDLLVEKRLDRRADKEAGLDIRESKRRRRENPCTSGRDGRKALRKERPSSTSQMWGRGRWCLGVSGQGNFKAKVWGFNLVESGRCVHRVVPDTAQHVLVESYEEWTELREFLGGR